ncbi:MAG: CPBP family intramembrane metalloprotease [Verrucomicrobiae bacterium]|nr:CPBP family intramembrane metalloprotease [Verrucomicrobiae bacterium]
MNPPSDPVPPRMPDATLSPVLSPSPHHGVGLARLAVALGILALYVLVPAILGAGRTTHDSAILPPTVRGVLLLSAWELTLFTIAFAVCVLLGRLRLDELLLRWRGGWWPLPRGLAWSIALRFGVGLFLVGSLLLWRFLSGSAPESLGGLRPQIESMVDVSALRNPWYLAVMLTIVSFVLAGFREELWRAGMLALLAKALPRAFGGRFGPWLALIPVALLFGLGHTAQGPVGVAATTLLGIGLGAIMLFHRSIWDAVLAHGFFNATTFALLPLLAEHFPELLGG